MSDIVERLRGNGQRAYFGDGAIMYDAAAEIERLRAQVAGLREALAKIAGMNQLNVTNYDRGRQQWDFQAIASAALEEK